MVTKALATDPRETTDAKSIVTFSIRFSEEQRSLLQRAADLRGWTPTQLLRAAALERAVHIINTSTPTRVDFRAVAVDVAKLVAGDRQVNYLDSDGVRAQAEVVDDLIVPFGVDGDDLGDALRVEIQPSSFASAKLIEFTVAARTGGAEFLSMLVEACNSASARSRQDLPSPLDPSLVISERGGGQ